MTERQEGVHGKNLIQVEGRQKMDVATSLTRDYLLGVKLVDSDVVVGISAYMHSSAERILSNTFSSHTWEQTMLRSQGELTEGEPISVQKFPYASGMLLVAKALAMTRELDGASPEMEYIATKTFLIAESEQYKRSSRNTVRSVTLTDKQRQIYKIADAKERKKFVAQVLKQEREKNSSDRERYELQTEEKLTAFVETHRLEADLQLLDSLAQVPLLEPSSRRGRVELLLSHVQIEENKKVWKPKSRNKTNRSRTGQSTPQRDKVNAYIGGLAPNTRITIKRISEATDVGERTVLKVFNNLVKEGKIASYRGGPRGSIVLGESIDSKVQIGEDTTIQESGRSRRPTPQRDKVDAYINGLAPGTRITATGIASATGVSKRTTDSVFQRLALEKKISSHPGGLGSTVLGDGIDPVKYGPKMRKTLDYLNKFSSDSQITAYNIAAEVGVSLKTAYTALEIVRNEGKFIGNKT